MTTRLNKSTIALIILLDLFLLGLICYNHTHIPDATKGGFPEAVSSVY